MKNIPGAVALNSLPVVGLKKVRDLEFFEGPLLSQFSHPSGDQYLYYWCDADEVFTRWIILRVSELDIIRLVNRFVPLSYVIPSRCKDDYVYLVDIDSEGTVSSVYFTSKQSIPNDYIPGKGAYLGQSPSTGTSYPVLIQGDLNTDDLVELPTKYAQAYGLLYTLDVLRPERFDHFPWRGGFSSMHFYRGVIDRLPREVRPAISAIQYASPGFFRFSLNLTTANDLARAIAETQVPRSQANYRFDMLRSYVTEYKLNDLRDRIPDHKNAVWAEHNQRLLTLTIGLLSSLKLEIAQPLLAAVEAPFEAAKIAQSFASRIRELSAYVSRGLILFPPVQE